MKRRNLETTNDPSRGTWGQLARRVMRTLWRGVRVAERAIRWCGAVAEAILAFYGVYWLLMHLVH